MAVDTKHKHKIPYSLRLAILLLRIAVGLDFFYLGFGTLFNPSLGAELRQKPLGDLYVWLNSSASDGWLHSIAPWVFIFIGICLVVGLATRLSSLIGMVLILINFWPAFNLTKASAFQAANDQIIILLSLLVIFSGKAGRYFGLDRFFHFTLRHKQ